MESRSVGIPRTLLARNLVRNAGDDEDRDEAGDVEFEAGVGEDDHVIAKEDGKAAWVNVDSLPGYLQRQIKALIELRDDDGVRAVRFTDGRGRNSGFGASWPDDAASVQIQVLADEDIARLATREETWVQLLLSRHCLTTRIAAEGLRPDLILDRARCYEHLGYDELAVGDAYVAFTLAGEESEDLVEQTVGADAEWDAESEEARKVKVGCLRIMVRALHRLGAVSEVHTWEELLEAETDRFEDFDDWRIFKMSDADEKQEPLEGVYGKCQRAVYPWNEHEPDRMSAESLVEINSKLKEASDGMLQCKKTILPSLSPSNDDTSVSDQTENAQLGLFATTTLPTSTKILKERSALTGIRAHGASLCDCCATNLETIDASSHRFCPGCSTPYCSTTCFKIASTTYHHPNTTSSDYPPPTAPFCAGPSSETHFADLGRAESSSTPEWDLYFLLIVRCIQISITLNIHPLDLFEIKYLWGAFTPTPSLQGLLPNTTTSSLSHTHPAQPTLPFSLNHHIILPFQLYEYLLLSLPDTITPYTRPWLESFDFWILNTLYAKFRGVATGQQSEFDGKPEIAQVHPLWCLANHSCEPNVGWESGGERGLVVRDWREGDRKGNGKGDGLEWKGKGKGLKEGDEVWNHYTDVSEKDVRVRRGRLMGVLGGECMCKRCMREYEEMKERGRASRA